MIIKRMIYGLSVFMFAISMFFVANKVFALSPPPATVMWMFYDHTPPSPTIQSKKIEVTVSWKEGTVTKTVKLYDILRSVVVP